MTKLKLSLLAATVATVFAAHAADLRIGIIGCDTSHAVAFTKIFNDPADTNHIPGGKVIVAYKGGSSDIPQSRDRIEEYTTKLQNTYGVKIVDSIPDLCSQVDVVLLESLDGRPKLAEAKPVILAGKPLFIDKPIAGSLKDAIAIDKLAREHHVPWFSSSAYRYYDGMIQVKNTKVGDIRSVVSYGPCELESHHPDIFWYGIHPTEALYTILGTGCQTVTRTTTADTEIVTGTWSDGRIGILIGQHACNSHRVVVFGSKTVAEQKGDGDYVPLCKQIMQFFQTGIAPVSNAETIELYTFMEAADASKRDHGKPISMAKTYHKNGGK